jgi:hypothetical protein
VLAVYEQTLSYLEGNPDEWPDRSTYEDALANLREQIKDIGVTVDNLE